jgi:ribosome maturation factor RimP
MVDEERIRSVVAPVVEGLGLNVVRVTWGQQGRSRTLRIDLDRRRTGPVDVPYRGSDVTDRDLADASREVSSALDARLDLSGRYVLEISSPGLDRHICSEQDFRDFTGHPVRIVLEHAVAGRRRFKGIIEGVKGGDRNARVVLGHDGLSTELELGNILSANLRPQLEGFGSDRARGGAGSRRHRTKKKEA